jgi:chromosome segregation ATPase
MLIDDILELLAAPRPAAAKPFLDRVDATLTDGYAHALQLEAERSRTERRIAEAVARLGDVAAHRHEPELVELSEKLMSANAEIASLRTLLTSLRDRRAELHTPPLNLS